VLPAVGIPADEVSRRVGFLAENRTNLTSGYMGVFLGASDPSAPETTVYLRGVVPESPADTAGLEGGDILARIEGLPLHSPRQAVQLLRRLSPNARIHVDLIREGRVERRTLILGQRQTELAPVDELVRVQLPRIREVALDRLRVNPMPPLPEDVDANPTMGVFVRGVSAPLREAIGWKGPESALVAMVLPGFPAEKAGLHAGDLLLDIDGRPVMRVPDVAAILETMRRGQVVTVRYFRQGRILTASVTLR
jgi:serine protease Do